MRRLSVYDIDILEHLDEGAGYTTAAVSRRIRDGFMSGQKRRRSAFLVQRLKALGASGLVKRMDPALPIAWMRTADGTKALAAIAEHQATPGAA